jgi:hypothetical protein
MKPIIALFASILVVGVSRRATGQLASAPQWRTLATEAYPKKRDDIVSADAQTGFYGTGKGKSCEHYRYNSAL